MAKQAAGKTTSGTRDVRAARWLRLSAVFITLAFLSTGCDPVVNFYGSFFPAWVICLALGIFLTALLRWLFAVIHLERNLGPLTLIYPALAFLLSASLWLALFGP